MQRKRKKGKEESGNVRPLWSHPRCRSKIRGRKRSLSSSESRLLRGIALCRCLWLWQENCVCSAYVCLCVCIWVFIKGVCGSVWVFLCICVHVYLRWHRGWSHLQTEWHMVPCFLAILGDKWAGESTVNAGFVEGLGVAMGGLCLTISSACVSVCVHVYFDP